MQHQGLARSQQMRQLWRLAQSESLPAMTDVNHSWSLSNPGPDTLLIWLEPWAEELAVPARSTIVLRPTHDPAKSSLGELEWTPEHLVVWASWQMIEIFIDGELQETASAVVPVPDGLTKGMLGILFGGRPPARLGGAHGDLIEHRSWWRRLIGR